MEARSLEEFVRGPEGDAERALVGALRRAQEAARGGSHDRVQLEVRVTPSNGEPSRQEATWTCKVGDSPDAVADRVLELLGDSPGPAFSGEIRINFRAHGDTRAHFGSYTRKVRPVSPTVPEGGGDEEGAPGFWEKVARNFAGLALDAQRVNVEQQKAGAVLMGGAATLVVNHARSTGRIPEAQPNKPGNVPVIHDLLRGVLKVGEAAAGKDSAAGKAAAVAGAAMDAGAPAPDYSAEAEVPRVRPDGTADAEETPAGGGGGGGLTRADVIAWMKANPDEAKEAAAEQYPAYAAIIRSL